MARREPTVTVRLDSLKPGARFRWCDVLFALREGDQCRVSTSDTPHLPVVYLERSGRGAFDAGDKGLMPIDEEVEPVEAIESRAKRSSK